MLGREESQTVDEIIILFIAAHFSQCGRACRDHIFQRVNCVGTHLVGCTFLPRVQNILTALNAPEQLIIIEALRVGVEGLTVAAVVVGRSRQLGHALDLANADDCVTLAQRRYAAR